MHRPNQRKDHSLSRRDFIEGSVATGALALLPYPNRAEAAIDQAVPPLEEVGYDQVQVRDARALAQRDNVIGVLLGLNEDSLLKPFREMAGLGESPGASLGGWYEWRADYNFHHDNAGLAPGATFGQWVSALARFYASSQFGGSSGRADLGERALRLNNMLAKTIAPGYFERTRFPAYSFDKLVCGLIDTHQWAGDASAFRTLDQVTAMARPSMPAHAVDREVQWKVGADLSWMWDESYTLPENLFLAAQRGAGPAYRSMAWAYLDDETYFEPLSNGTNVLSDKHAYSYVNALCSAMQAYLTDHSGMHFEAAKTGFAMLEAQSYATGGWGPDEMLRKPGYDQLAKSLTATHNSFETPCGSYAHMKLTRYLLRATRDGHYGDSMERIMLNTIVGVLPLEPDGRSFYYADYNVAAKRIYSEHRWPCCSGTFPQVVADYGINGYLQEPDALWVNLYQASELHWRLGGRSVSLEQTGSYLEDGKVRLILSSPEPARFTLHLRVPAWAGSNVRLRVNGGPATVNVQKGFTSIDRIWRSGDRVEIEFPMSLRLEELPANGGPAHAQTVALLWGPLVLMAVRNPEETGPLHVSRSALLGAERTGVAEWLVKGATGSRDLMMVPFVDVGDRVYSTYLNAI